MILLDILATHLGISMDQYPVSKQVAVESPSRSNPKRHEYTMTLPKCGLPCEVTYENEPYNGALGCGHLISMKTKCISYWSIVHFSHTIFYAEWKSCVP